MRNVRALVWVMGALGASCAGAPGPAVPVTVRFFVGTECPVSNFYAPEMRRLYEVWAPRGVRFQAVYPESGVRAEVARSHAELYGLPFPVVLDAERTIADACGVTRIPTAVIDGAYRGRIDDRWSADGKRRDVPRAHELEDALAALVVGRVPEVKETPVFGCLLP